MYITTFNREQYWGIFLVFIFNFTMAHLFALLLNSAIMLREDSNWLMLKGLKEKAWFIRYVWGYYWGTTTMLTIGFGDFVATN